MKTIDKTDPKYRLNKVERVCTGMQIIFTVIVVFFFFLGLLIYEKLFKKNIVANINEFINEL